MSSSVDQGKQTPASAQRRHLSQSVVSGNQSQRIITQPSSFMQSPMHDGASTVNGESGQISWGTNINTIEIVMKFEKFLLEFTALAETSSEMQVEGEEGQLTAVYVEKLRAMADIEEYTLTLDGLHLYEFDKLLYNQLIFFPAEVIQIFDKVTQTVFRDRFAENDLQIQGAGHILVAVFNIRNGSHLRDLRPKHINRLVSIKCIIIRVSDVYPEMKVAAFKCTRCNHTVYSALERAHVEEPNDCEICRIKNSFQIQHNLCHFTDKQYIKVQELPESVMEGETPQTATLMAYDLQLVDHVKPGDKVDVVGVYRATGMRKNRNKRTLKAVYNTYIDVVSYTHLNKQSIIEDKIQFSEEEREKFYKLTEREDIYELLVKSLAPSIWENTDVKKGILAQLFGGNPKKISDQSQASSLNPMGRDPGMSADTSIRTRAEINTLLVGDPSVAKSQLLKYVHNIAPRGIYTSGKGSSAVGLTAYVTRDPETREVVLESGALVLSDLGICCIDEFDKMDENTRTILHEVMEQQTISIAKAGIVASLNARTAILAGANPVNSRYNPRRSVIDNINLPPSLLSRFDLIYIMLDTQDDKKDQKLAEHMLNLYSSMNSNRVGSNQEQILEVNIATDASLIKKDTLRRYISYARQEIQPILSQIACNKLIEGYVGMRKLGMNNKVITSTTRQLESLIRIAEALAKMKLSNEVTGEDVDEAIRLMQVATQSAATDPTTGLIDMDMLATGISAQQRQRHLQISEIIDVLISEIQGEFKKGMTLLQLRERVAMKEGHSDYHKVDEKDIHSAIHILVEANKLLILGNKKNPTIKLGTGLD